MKQKKKQNENRYFAKIQEKNTTKGEKAHTNTHAQITSDAKTQKKRSEAVSYTEIVKSLPQNNQNKV